MIQKLGKEISSLMDSIEDLLATLDKGQPGVGEIVAVQSDEGQTVLRDDSEHRWPWWI